MQFFKLLQGTGLIKDSNIIGISGASGGIGSTAQYSQNILKIESRLEDPPEKIAQEFRNKSIVSYIHLAAATDNNWCDLHPEECFLVNAEYAKKFYEAASMSKVRRFIFVSSSHVYDYSINSPLDIYSPTIPKSIYGQSKLLAEQKLIALKNSNTKLSIARVFSVIGKNARDHFLYQGLHKRAKDRNFSDIPGLDNIRDFLEADQVMSELIRLANSKDYPPLLNICSGQGQSIRKIAKEVFASYGLEKKIEKMKSNSNHPPNKIIGVPTKFI